MKKFLKMKKNNTLIYIALIPTILLLLIYCINTNYNTIINYILDKYSKPDTCIVTDTLRYVDTLTFFKEKPIEKKIYLTKIDTFYTKEGKDTVLKTENKHYIDTLCVQKDTAIIQNYISGINANLDSTRIQLRKTKEVITNTIEITKYIEKKKTFWNRFHLGVQAGYGYGFEYKGLEPYVGLGGSFDL